MTDADGRLYPARPILAASVAVVRGGKVLLAERAKPPAPHVFSLPGGVVESGEQLRQAALRELMEETGVSARIVAFNDHVEVIERDARGLVVRHFVVASFAAEWLAGDGAPLMETRRVLWADAAEAAALATTSGLLPIIARAVRLVASA